MILVSACLLGQCTRYDARLCPEPGLITMLTGKPHIALCPELLGGLSIPRDPARIVGASPGREGQDVLTGNARVIDSREKDVTGPFVKGAKQALDIALEAGVKEAYLKDRSPSCGYDPQGINPKGGPGYGILAALLVDAGIKVIEVRAKAAPEQE